MVRNGDRTSPFLGMDSFYLSHQGAPGVQLDVRESKGEKNGGVAKTITFIMEAVTGGWVTRSTDPKVYKLPSSSFLHGSLWELHALLSKGILHS